MKNNTLFTLNLPKNPGEVQSWGEVSGLGIALSILSAAHQASGPVLIISSDSLSAKRLHNELLFVNSPTDPLPLYLLPDWEILPYDHFSPHQDIISERLLTLSQLPETKRAIVIVPVNTLMHRIAPRQHLEAHVFSITKGMRLDSDAFRQRLIRAGYRATSQVLEHGEYSQRGSIIDLYPMGSLLPYRIDLFDDEIETIRTFDPDTQCSLEIVEKIALLPAQEYPLTEEAITQFRQSWRENFSGNPAKSPLYQSISDGLTAPGIEYYLPLFYDKLESVFDYLPTQSLVISVEDIATGAEHFRQEVLSRYEQLRYDTERPILAPHDITLAIDELFGHIKKFPQIKITHEKVEDKPGRINLHLQKPSVSIEEKKEFSHHLKSLFDDNIRVLWVAESAGRQQVLYDLLQKTNIKPETFDYLENFISSSTQHGITTAPVFQGVNLKDKNILILTEGELFGEKVIQQRRRQGRSLDPNTLIRNLSELQIGSPIVHIDHGVGRYLGLQSITTDGIEAEYLTIEYAEKHKLYVPVGSLHLVSRYSGADTDTAPLHQLGSSRWQKAKRKAAEKARDAAAELLDIYARRESKIRDSYGALPTEYVDFAATFPFEETPDQQQAIQMVINDLAKTRPMDRLICGDVGFGKTEVAMRAAFIVAYHQKQVAVLVPTTLLAEQHFNNFRDRFAKLPVTIEMISRFRSQKEQQTILANCAEGKVDIIIGTHKLLQPDIKFKNLGLLIIDEEHRFGVRQKERIKSLRANVDILTLTATPIPRTLNLAMSSIRDLSIIATPPARRLAINTFVHEYSPALIKEAMLREILRGGQVYYLHNDVKSIKKIADEIEQLVPEAKTGVAHGQMRERELEKVMADFYHRRFSVLVCTTIIESGIDVPSANTIIINRADKFGLAQLHQIRGRVGRSHHQAYAYLLTPPENILTADAQKRLEAIASLSDLGAGFALATNDLEIRGAGEILGEEQSGHIQEVGFTLYTELLENAVKALKSGESIDLDREINHGPEIDLGISALIPETYVHDINLRLTLYKRLSSCKNNEELQELQVEFIDRFGQLPDPARHLFIIAEIKLLATRLGITKILVRQQNGRLDLEPEPKINVENLIKLIQSQPTKYRFEGANCIRFNTQKADTASKISSIQQLLSNLT
ncbi:MAG: transcription-repair coupling factor [Gammaproteobacteria bacterium]|nr:transcription-repair coupling factor [Gammaproteobacteria bacterium]